MRSWAIIVMASIAAGACSSAHTSTAAPTVQPPLALNRLRVMPSSDFVEVWNDPSKRGDQIRFGGGPLIPLSNVFEAMTTYYGDGSEKTIVVDASADSGYGTVLTVLDAARVAGFRTFSILNRTASDPIGQTPAHGFVESFERGQERHLRTVGSASSLHSVQIEVTASNGVAVDGRSVSSGDIYEALASSIAYHRTHKGFLTHIDVIADANASWGTIVTILDAGRQAGDDDIGFVTGG